MNIHCLFKTITRLDYFLKSFLKSWYSLYYYISMLSLHFLQLTYLWHIWYDITSDLHSLMTSTSPTVSTVHKQDFRVPICTRNEESINLKVEYNTQNIEGYEITPFRWVFSEFLFVFNVGTTISETLVREKNISAT